MLNRENSPLKGLWNGIEGKVENGGVFTLNSRYVN